MHRDDDEQSAGEELSEEVQAGREMAQALVRDLVEHMEAMGAAEALMSVELYGVRYQVIVRRMDEFAAG